MPNSQQRRYRGLSPCLSYSPSVVRLWYMGHQMTQQGIGKFHGIMLTNSTHLSRMSQVPGFEVMRRISIEKSRTPADFSSSKVESCRLVYELLKLREVELFFERRQ